MPGVLASSQVQCLDEDLITDLAAGRVRLDAPGVEEHLAACPSCTILLGAAVAELDARSGPGVLAADPGATVPHGRTPAAVRGRTALAPGTVLRGTYIVQRQIGSGGMGEVYEVAHVRLAGRYAVKVLRADISGDEELLARFRREAEITSALRHPHIVQVMDFDRAEDGCVFLAMEYLEGCDLATLLEREVRLDLPRTLGLVNQIVSALAAAHRRGIVHRDLKPANVFVLRDEEAEHSGIERVKLMDFGLSKWTEVTFDVSLSLSREQALIGTPRYMAPEQARGRNRQISVATDQFALAAMVYEMLTGDAPFSGATLGEILHAILYEEPKDLFSRRPDLPPGVAVAVHRALAKEPENRFPSIQAFCQALEKASTARVSDAGPGRTRPRRRWPLALVGVAAVGAIAGLGLLWPHLSDGPSRATAGAAAAKVELSGIDLGRAPAGPVQSSPPLGPSAAPPRSENVAPAPTTVAQPAATPAPAAVAPPVATPVRARPRRSRGAAVARNPAIAPEDLEPSAPAPSAPPPAATAAVREPEPAGLETAGAPEALRSQVDAGAPPRPPRRKLDLIESL